MWTVTGETKRTYLVFETGTQPGEGDTLIGFEAATEELERRCKADPDKSFTLRSADEFPSAVTVISYPGAMGHA